MADQLSQLTDEIATLKQAVTDTNNRVSGVVNSLNQTIADLKAHPAAADLTQQIADLADAINTINGIAPAAPAPATDAPAAPAAPAQ